MRIHSRRLAVLATAAAVAAIPSAAYAQTPVDGTVDGAIGAAPDPVDATATPGVAPPASAPDVPHDALPTVGTHPQLPDVTVPLPTTVAGTSGISTSGLGTATGTSGGTAKAWPGGAFVTRSTPVVFVHGLDWQGTSSVDCRKTFGTMMSRMRDWGWSGTFHTVKYYDYDAYCSNSIDHHPSHISARHSQHYASGHKNGSHTNDTDIRHLAYHLAWDINDHFGSVSNVQLVAHSMGGLITRYAIAQTARGHSQFPGTLMVSNVVTLGTPHLGSGWARGCAGWVFQCKQMTPGSSFIEWLRYYAQDPQGYNGTDWTLVGSENDGVVSQGSGTGMRAAHKVIYGYGIGHSDYLKHTGPSDSDVKWYDSSRGYWSNWYSAPRVVRWTEHGLAATSW